MSERHLAPIAVFGYRRASHLSETLDALESCPEFAASPVFVFSDGPKTEAVAGDVSRTREMLHARRRENMTIVEAETNQGLAASIVAGVTRLCDQYGRVIVIEDDLIVHPTALQWFNTCLDHYAEEPNVFQIGAYQYKVPEFEERQTGTVQRFVTSWGWATWKPAWDYFDAAATGWEAIDTNTALEREFNCGGAYPFDEMLRLQIAGKIDSWAIRWWWTVFRAGGVSILPPRSLVRNTGFDGTATHNSIGWLKRFAAPPQPKLWEGAGPPALPSSSQISGEDVAAFRRALRRTGAFRNRRIKQTLRAFGLFR